MYFHKALFLFPLVFITACLYSQTTVTSLEELKPYLRQGGVTVKLVPGTYSINAADIAAGKFSNPLFLFEGSNSTYDFTDVIINIDTEVMRGFGSVDFREIIILGNNNVIKNLTTVDIGSAFPTKRATNIVMDGQENRIEGLHMTVRGSYPYGYGDIFGKGGPTVIRHHKHSALLIRGYKNHIKDCTIIHRAYGHAVFMQAADEPIIENCYIEGELRSTDDILAEEGTGSDADKVHFESVWGYRLPAGFMISLQEAGIRAYDAGTTYINGETFERAASNVTVLNCTVVNMRSGVTLSHANGFKYVEGTTVLGCESGFAIGNGNIVSCSGDAKHGPLYNSTYGNDKEIFADITVIPSDTIKNGSGILAYIGGGSHDITFRSQEPNSGSDLSIQFGGHSTALRNQQPGNSTNDLNARYVKIKSEVWNPIVLHEDTRNCTGYACGFVFDNGLYNEIRSSEICDQNSDCNNIPTILKATCYDAMSGIDHETTSNGALSISNIQDGDWSMYNDIDISDMNSVMASVTGNNRTEGKIEVRLDDVSGELLTTLMIVSNGDENENIKVTENIGRIYGVHDIYFVYKGDSNTLFNIQWFSFSKDVVCGSNTRTIEAECYNGMSGIQTANCSEGSKNISSINDENWTMYSNIDLTNISSVKVRVASRNEGGSIEMYIDSPDGIKIADILISNTGGWQTWTTDSSEVSNTEGIHNIYFVYKGEEGYLLNFNSFELSEGLLSTSTRDILESHPNLNVFPNPVQDRLTITNGKGASLKLYSATGELKLSKSEINGDLEIATNDLPSGIYFLKISIEGQSIIRKIVKL